jgi:adenosine deaminase
MKITRDFIEKIPKTDLHVHLDGSIRLATLIDLAGEDRVELPAYTEEELKKTVFKDTYKNLEEYLRCFGYTTAVLQRESALERVAYELALDNQAEGVRYLEVRFAPQLHQNKGLSIRHVVEAVHRGLKRAREEFNDREVIRSGKEPPFEYGLIVCAMRMFDYNYSKYYDSLLDVHRHSERKWIYSLASQELVRAAVKVRDSLGLPIVGFDLAGMEKGYPAGYFKAAFSLAHKRFLKKTVHAGEDYGPESIFQAITECYTDRIGHGVHLFSPDMIQDNGIKDREAYVDNLVQYIADRRITVEVCLTSNLQTNPGIENLLEHSFMKMRDAKLSVTFCTDNRTVSNTTVTDELVKAVKTFDIDTEELRKYVVYGFKRSFYPGTYLQKRNYVRQVFDYYEALEAEMLENP